MSECEKPFIHTAHIHIPFFWWARERQMQQRPPADIEYIYVPAEADYIPTSTADLWRRASMRRAS